MRRALLFRAAVCCAAAVSWQFVESRAGRLQVVAVSGEVAPGGGVYRLGLQRPALNDAGMVAFAAASTSDGGDGPRYHAYRFDSATSSAVRMTPSPIYGVNSPAINANGLVAVYGDLFESRQGVVVADGTSLQSLARSGSSLTDEPELSLSWLGRYLGGPRINAAGQTAFRGGINREGDPPSATEAILFADGESLTAVAYAGAETPDEMGEYSAFRVAPALNDAGQVAFSALIRKDTDHRRPDWAAFRADATGVTTVFQSGQRTLVGTLDFSGFSPDWEPVMNASGQIAMVAWGRFGEGVFVGDGETTRLIALSGAPVLDGDGEFGGFVPESVSINDAGQVGFSAGDGLFRGDGVELVTIVREEDPAPGGDGVFRYFRGPTVLNNASQMAFVANLSGGDRNEGIYVYDDQRGVLEVIRTGAPLLGSTVAQFTFHDAIRGVVLGGANENSGFNARGQVAFGFRLADGRSGVALWTVPEPSGSFLVAIAVLSWWLKGGVRGRDCLLGGSA